MNKTINKIKDIFKNLGEHRLILLLSGAKSLDFAEKVIEELDLKNSYLISNSMKSQKFKNMKFSQCRKLLGQTTDAIFFDLNEDLPPREFGIVVETIKGPGILFLYINNPEEWINKKLKFHVEILTPPYKLEDCRNIFQRRFLKILKESAGVIHIDTENDIIVFENKLPKQVKRSKIIAKKTKILLPEIGKLSKTQDQMKVYYEFDKIIQKENKFAFVVLANRGRGKSAVLGMIISSLILNGKKIILTGPSYDSVKEVFKFIKKGLKTIGAKFVDKEYLIKCDKGEVIFKEPYDCLKSKGDFLFIDEAAAIHVTILKKLSQKFNRIIISTTTHGYEGTGRLFQYRLLPYLKERFKVFELKMEEPIRYGIGDPLESFLYKVFCLDAEPCEIDENIDVLKLEFKPLDLEKLYLEDEEKLRQFVGIYIFAHYRNNPKDVMLLADAPNQKAFCAIYNGKIVGSLQVAEEGNLSTEDIKNIKKGKSPHGNITPDLMYKYYGEEFLLKNKGARIIRIAVHPKLMRKGIGSFLLKNLEKVKEYSWFSASFGGSENLIRFWTSNDYKIVHISPKMNHVSGEYPVLVLKCNKIPIEEYSRYVKMRLLFELPNYYKKMEPEVVLTILKSLPKCEISFNFGSVEKFKLKRYVKKYLKYEGVSDIFNRLLIYYYSKNIFDFADDLEHLVLIEKVLKHLNWNMICEDLELDKKSVSKILSKGCEHLAKYFLKSMR